MTYQRQIGALGEKIARGYLERKGYQIIDQNFSSRFGELDLVALDSGIVVFVEVKARTSAAFGSPETSITPAKLDRIQCAGLMWLQGHPDMPDDWRIDVVAIQLDREKTVQDIQHFVSVYL